MKEFRLLVGTSEDNMVQVLHSGLKNDSLPETFTIRHVNQAGISFPTRYVQIVPLSYVINHHLFILLGLTLRV